QKVITILGIMSLQKCRQIQQRLSKYAALTKHQRDQESSDTSVAITKRMDRFELAMGQSKLYNNRQIGTLVEKLFKLLLNSVQFSVMRRHETGVRVGLSLPTN